MGTTYIYWSTCTIFIILIRIAWPMKEKGEKAQKAEEGVKNISAVIYDKNELNLRPFYLHKGSQHGNGTRPWSKWRGLLWDIIQDATFFYLQSCWNNCDPSEVINTRSPLAIIYNRRKFCVHDCNFVDDMTTVSPVNEVKMLTWII